MIDSRLTALMVDWVTVVRSAGVDSYGGQKFTGEFGSQFAADFGGTAYPARVQYDEVFEDGTTDGVEGDSGVAYLPGDVAVSPQDKIMLNNNLFTGEFGSAFDASFSGIKTAVEYDPSAPVVLSVSKVWDDEGVHHTKIRFKA